MENNSNKEIIPTASEYNTQIQIFLTVILLGYFGIKIVYGYFFGYYPQKYYYRNITVDSSQIAPNTNFTKNIAVNAFIPGMWNNEMTDIITCLVLSFVVFSFSYYTNRSIFKFNGTVHPAFMLGYLFGLCYPLIANSFGDALNNEVNSDGSGSCVIRYIYLISLVGIIILIMVLNYTSKDVSISKPRKINLSTYFLILFLLLFGLIFSKKNSKNYQYVTYNYSDGTTCANNVQTTVQSSGDVINITPPFAAFVIMLLFSYQPESVLNQYLYVFIYAILMGIFVSGLSYYGLEYFLVKMPQQEVSQTESMINQKELGDNSQNQKNEYQKMANDSYTNKADLTFKEKTEAGYLTLIQVAKGAAYILLFVIIMYFIYISIVKRI